MDNKYKGGEALNRIIDGHGEPINLKFSLLEDITDNFSDLRKIGHGGCGQVYKGIFANRFIAVKKLFNDRTWDDKMFNSEVKSLIKAKHPNIVNFFGYCCNTEEKFQQVGGVHIRAEIRERLLCFEFIPNGSLENYLTDELRGLEWCTRYQIIEGICSGLCHLHKDVGIIHMDLKPANILLDGHFPDLVPKITDFGLARLADVSKTTSQDRLLSLGYCAPEYEKSGHMSIKSDIYSLGVIILELMTGSKKTPSTINVLRRWVHRWNKSKKNTPLEYHQVAKCIELAVRCMDMDPCNRPNAWDIISELNEMKNKNYDEFLDDQLSNVEAMLCVEPLELYFPFEQNKKISCSLELTNNTESYIAFDIRVERSDLFSVQPEKDVIGPGSKHTVIITLQAQKKVPELKHSTNLFIVKSTRVDEVLKSMQITEDVFTENTVKVVDMVTLTVAFDAPQTPEERKQDLPVTSQSISSVGEYEKTYGTPPQKVFCLYTTTLSSITNTFENCNIVRKALQLLPISFVEKDLFDRPDILKELKDLTNGKPFKLPVLSINGNCIYDAPKLLELIHERDLSRLF